MYILIYTPSTSHVYPMYTPSLSHLPPIYIPSIYHLYPIYIPFIAHVYPIFYPMYSPCISHLDPMHIPFRSHVCPIYIPCKPHLYPIYTPCISHLYPVLIPFISHTPFISHFNTIYALFTSHFHIHSHLRVAFLQLLHHHQVLIRRGGLHRRRDEDASDDLRRSTKPLRGSLGVTFTKIRRCLAVGVLWHAASFSYRARAPLPPTPPQTHKSFRVLGFRRFWGARAGKKDAKNSRCVLEVHFGHVLAIFWFFSCCLPSAKNSVSLQSFCAFGMKHIHSSCNKLKTAQVPLFCYAQAKNTRQKTP